MAAEDNNSYECMVCKSLGRSCHPGCAFPALIKEQQGSFITASKLEALCSFYNVSFIDSLTRQRPPTPENLKTLDRLLSDLYYRYLFYLENQNGNLTVVLMSMETHVRNLLEKFDKEEEAIRAQINKATLEGRTSLIQALKDQLFFLDSEKSMRQLQMDMELIE